MRALSISGVRAGIVAAAAALLIHASPAVAQTQQLPDSVRELVDEFQEKQAQLQEIQARALEGSEELQEAQAHIQGEVQTAMAEIDPQFEERIERLGQIRTEAQAAQAEQDEEAISSLVAEAQQLQTTLSETRDQALEREEIQTEITAFQELLLEEMVRLEPEVESLIARLEELALRLSG